jgi:chemotaxis protein histidine kinase CheA
MSLGGFSMFDLYKAEAEQHGRALSDGLVALESATDPKLVEPLMRAAHSIKGAARIVGFEQVVTLAHAMEDCLVRLQRAQEPIVPARVDQLLKGTDLLVQSAQVAEADVPLVAPSHVTGKPLPAPVAAAMKADRCDIYTDVDGVYTTDPRICDKARKLDKIAFEEMLELASLGAKVLQTRSVELAMRYKVRLRVLSSFEDTDETSGTLVCDEDEIMESKVVSGVAYSRDEAKMTLVKVEDRPGIAAAIFGPLAEAGVNVDMIVQNISELDDPSDKRAYTDMTFSLPTNQVERARKAMEDAKAAGKFTYGKLVTDTDVAKISVVGIGMRSQVGVAAKMFAALAAENVNIKVISTSEIKISVLIDRKYMELAVQALHDVFELDKA